MANLSPPLKNMPENKARWKQIGDYLLANLKFETLKFFFSKIFKNAPMVGFKAWLFKLAFNLFWDRLAEPIIKYAIRKGLLAIDKHKGNIQIKKLQEARDADDKDAYDDVVDDIFK